MSVSRFANEYELQKIVQRCHNVLWERHGFDPAQAFDEFSKLLFVKLYDEATMVGARTVVQRDEPLDQFAARVRWLFDQANQTGGFDHIFTDDDTIYGDDLSIYQVFKQLRNYSLLETTSKVQGADVKGTIYEHIIGNTFRGELGQFFTHRSIVEFMVKFVGIDERKVVYDPSCGSGGFLIMCAKVIKEQIRQTYPDLSRQEISQRLEAYSRRCLIGTEINERTARVARLNLLMHGLDYSNVFTVNALRTDETGDERLRTLVSADTVDVVFANPPFAGYEKDPSVLSRFELGKNHGRAAAVTREVLFIERIIQVLREGGVAAIVIPQGIFTNRNLAHVRDYIRRHTQVLAVIELPDWAFIPSGTSVRGSLLFIRKAAQTPNDYEVFMKRVENIGFTSTGRPSDLNDLPQTLVEYRQRDPRYLVPIHKVKDRLDAKFYISEHKQIVDLFNHNSRHKLVKLSDMGSFYTERVNPRLSPDREIMLVETSGVDPVTLTITPKYIEGRDSNYTSLKQLQTGDILISRRRAYRGAIVVVPPELNGALAISEFSVLRLREGYDRDYVVEILRSPQFLKLMTIYSTGEMSGRVAEKDLRRLQIPISENHRDLGVIFKTHRQRIEELKCFIAEAENEIVELAASLIEGR
jgi:type I restriction enzyme M protein